MNPSARTLSEIASAIPAEDPERYLAIARLTDDPDLPHIGLVGDTYTILPTGDDTAGRYTLILPGHDLRRASRQDHQHPGQRPHQSHNVSEHPVLPQCICSPSGQEEFFMAVGVPVASRMTPPPTLDATAHAAFKTKGEALAPKYRRELLPHA
ncbi:MAG TPA: hypothetical protein VFW98_13375 [Gemmatimonadaceae bacterium]|nr:hypothetical protein [Gemmatimonadaceae bacterium]